MQLENSFSNPLGWAQIRLQGGWKKILGFAAVYAAAVLVFHVVIYRVMGNINLSVFAGYGLTVMTFAQVLIIFIAGVGSIKKAIHRDFTSEMITSHRMTEMNGYTATIGYLTGATARIWMLVLVNWLASTVLAALASMPILLPTTLLIIFGCLGLMCWTFAILVGLGTRGATSIGGVLILIIVLWQSGAITAIPGLALLVGHTSVWTLQNNLQFGIKDVTIVVSMVAQLTFALTFFVAASRKFCRDDVPAFTPQLAFALLAACTLLSAVGLEYWPGSGGPRAVFTIRLETKCIVTLIVLALVAFLPVATIALNDARWATRSAKDSEFREPRPSPFWLGPVFATLIVFDVLLAVASGGKGILNDLVRGAGLHEVVLIVAPFFLCVMTVGAISRCIYARANRAIWFLLGYAMLFWAAPPLLDQSLAFAMDRASNSSYSWVFGCSPVGTWIIAFGSGAAWSAYPGLAFQAVVAGMSLLFASRARH